MSNLRAGVGRTLTFNNGNTVTLKKYGTDVEGEYLVLQHLIRSTGPINGPHWHPVLQEKFMIEQGVIRFLVDGRTIIAGPGEHVHILPKQTHQAWKDNADSLQVIHEIRPPGHHWTMFELLHKLESEGKLNSRGIPRNPLWLGLVWKTMDGYIKGPPSWVQRIVLGGLAKLAKANGYRTN